MKSLIRYDYTGGFYIYRVWADEGNWYFTQSPQTQTVKATYYKGILTVIDAFDKSLVGLQFTKFIDFTQHPKWNVVNEFQKVKLNGFCEWFCLHHDTIEIETRYLELITPTEIPAGTSVVVLEGTMTGDSVTAIEMQHIKPRLYPYTVTGNGKAFLIRIP